MTAKSSLKLGQEFPFDAPDSWWYRGEHEPKLDGDWAVIAARGVIANLSDRRGIKRPLDIQRIDEDVRAEIIQTLAAIIRLAWQEEGEG